MEVGQLWEDSRDGEVVRVVEVNEHEHTVRVETVRPPAVSSVCGWDPSEGHRWSGGRYWFEGRFKRVQSDEAPAAPEWMVATFKGSSLNIRWFESEEAARVDAEKSARDGREAHVARRWTTFRPAEVVEDPNDAVRGLP